MATNDLLSIAEARAALNIGSGVTTHDDKITPLVTAVSQKIDELCGPVVKRTITETLRPTSGSGVLFPTYTPVASITTVTEYVSGTGTALTAESLGTSGTYLIDGDLLYRRSSWSGTAWLGDVEVVYVAGRYDSTATVEERFKQAAREFLRFLWTPAHAAGTDTFGPANLGLTIPSIDVPRTVLGWLAGELKAPAIA